MNIVVKIASCFAIGLAIFVARAEAQFFPSRYILESPVIYSSGQGSEFRRSLQELGFVIAKQDSDRWRIDGSIYSSPSKALREQLGSFQGCRERECEIFWASRNQYPPFFSEFFAHTYRFLWIEIEGTVHVIFEDHSLWRGNL